MSGRPNPGPVQLDLFAEPTTAANSAGRPAAASVPAPKPPVPPRFGARRARIADKIEREAACEPSAAIGWHPTTTRCRQWRALRWVLRDDGERPLSARAVPGSRRRTGDHDVDRGVGMSARKAVRLFVESYLRRLTLLGGAEVLAAALPTTADRMVADGRAETAHVGPERWALTAEPDGRVVLTWPDSQCEALDLPPRRSAGGPGVASAGGDRPACSSLGGGLGTHSPVPR